MKKIFILAVFLIAFGTAAQKAHGQIAADAAIMQNPRDNQEFERVFGWLATTDPCPSNAPKRIGVTCSDNRAAIAKMSANILLPPPLLNNFLTNESVDTNLGYNAGSNAWTLQFNDDDNAVQYNVEDALLYVGSPSQSSRPASSQFNFIGVAAGDSYHQLPQSQNPNLLYLGFSGFGATPSDFDRYDPAAESKGRVSSLGRWLKISLLGVNHTTPTGTAGDGKFSVWQSGETGPNVFMSSYNDGVSNANANGLDTTDGISADDALWIVAGGRLRYNWGFTRKGRYAVTVKLSGYRNDGNTTVLGQYFESQPFTMYFSVGSVGQTEFAAATSSVSENSGTATVTVRRVDGSDGRITVNYATGDGTATAGSDYTSTSGTLTFNDQETVKTFTIPILSDGISEGSETVNLTLSSPGPSSINGYLIAAEGDANGLLGSQSASTLIIADAPPTAAAVSISGRVLTPQGRGVSRAQVYLTNQNGEILSRRTSTFGHYRFDDIAAGQTVVISVVSKRYSFAPQVLNASEGITDLDFTAQE
jgi:hypothetical protein